MHVEHTYAPRLRSLRRPAHVTPRPEVRARRDTDVLLGVGLAAIAIVLLTLVPKCFLQDSWLALVAGRNVAQHGIPYHETLTIFGHGRTWIDQQWLSQLLMYGSYQI